ncbi:MAG: hypothetical protein EBZ77_13970, partial [Chitinophagia bacterium]|nr:hypothetical protein [Chitinophagia bacterium]
MALTNADWEKFLPGYLTAEAKERLKKSLLQFRSGNESFRYNDFYKSNSTSYFAQGDLIAEIRIPVWDDEAGTYQKKYTDAIILSNTCDISADNKRGLNQKECLLAPIVNIKDHCDTLRAHGYSEQKITEFLRTLKLQEHTNLFYLPPTNTNSQEYFAILDKVFWVTTEEINALTDTITDDRIATLNHYGYY